MSKEETPQEKQRKREMLYGGNFGFEGRTRGCFSVILRLIFLAPFVWGLNWLFRYLLGD